MDLEASLRPLPEEDFSRVLCIVAHPDDIEYGLSAAVGRWSAAGKSVAYFLLTRGEAGIDTLDPEQAAIVREAEERASARVVGVRSVEFGGHVDGILEYGLPLRRDIAREIRRVKPELVVTGGYANRFAAGGVNQADHRAVGLAASDAVADAGNRWIFPELVEQGLEPWNGVRWLCFTRPCTPSHFVDVTGHLEDAVASLEQHRRYNEALPADFPAPRELLTGFLGADGAAAGVEHAVLLEAVKRH